MRTGLAFLVLLGAGCATGPRLPLPYSAAQLAIDSPRYGAAALVHYLGQPEADPAVCDVTRAGEHIAVADAQTFTALLAGLDRGAIVPRLWRACAALLLPRLPPGEAERALRDVAEAAMSLLPAADADPVAAARARALVELFADRPTELRPGVELLARLDAQLGERLAGGVGPLGRELALGLREAVELDRGRWAGEAVTALRLRVIDDVPLLLRFGRRLPAAELRAAARRRAIEVQIDASPFAELGERREAVIDAVLARGRNAIPLRQTAIRRVALRAGAALPQILVRQDVRRQTASLWAERAGGGATLLPALALRGELTFELVGVSRPVTFCGPRAALDPTPCVDAVELDLGTPLARFDDEGNLQLASEASLKELAASLAPTPTLTLAPRWEGIALLQLELPLAFAPPAKLVLHGDTSRTGPKLEVTVSERGPWLVVWTEDQSEGSRPRRVAIVPRAGAAAFQVVSRGGDGQAGYAGAPGAQGNRGSNGTPAMCPSSPGGRGGDGSPGGRGGDGGPGGPGGDGGRVLGRIECPAGACPELLALARQMLRSEAGTGGAGGPGGAGGRGGDGGSGGSGTSCTSYDGRGSTFLAGGSPGAKGADGPAGSRGRDGPDGQPGEVVIELASATR